MNTVKSLGHMLVAITVIAAARGSAAWADEAQQIWRRARTKLESKTDQAHVVLKIIEPGGETKAREMNLQILRTKTGFKSLIRLTAPADIKRTAMLAEMKDGQDREWLFVPSSKEVRRIAGTKRSTGVLGSELCPQDLDPTILRDAKVTLVHKDTKSAVIAMVPAPSTSEYSKVLMTFSLPESLPEKSEYYRGTKLEKTVQFLNYKNFKGGVARAQLIHIMNVEKKRGTDLEFSDMKVNMALLEKDFTPNALKEN